MNATTTRRLSGAALVLVSLLFGVVACGSDDDGDEAAGDRPQVRGPNVGDHWHAPFGIFVCDDFLPPVADVGPGHTGLHSHADGLIHIHPGTERDTDEGANLDRFGESVGVVFGDTYVRLADGGRLDEGDDDCDGEPADLRLAVWEDGAGEPTIIQSGIADHAPRDGAVLTLVFAPADVEPEQPPWAGQAPTDV